MQEDSVAVVDTLTENYADKWSGTEGAGDVGMFVEFMSSADLIFVVLGVTLIIWCVLLLFLFRVDKKVQRLEDQIKSS